MSVVLIATWHPGLQGERVCSHHGKERAQPLGLTDSLPHLGPPPLGPRHLGPANLALVSHAIAALSTGQLGKDQYPTVFLSLQFSPPVLGLSNVPVTVCFSIVKSRSWSLMSLSISICVSQAFRVSLLLPMDL